MAALKKKKPRLLLLLCTALAVVRTMFCWQRLAKIGTTSSSPVRYLSPYPPFFPFPPGERTYYPTNIGDLSNNLRGIAEDISRQKLLLVASNVSDPFLSVLPCHGGRGGVGGEGGRWEGGGRTPGCSLVDTSSILVG